MPPAPAGAEGSDEATVPSPGAPGGAARPRVGGAEARTRVDRTRIDRARIDAVFGETLPEATSDDARVCGDRIDDDWWRAQRPPHHG